MTKQITISELRDMIKAAPIARHIEHIGESIELDQNGDDKCLIDYCIVQTVTVNGLKFWTQALLQIPADDNNEDEPTILRPDAWDLISVDQYGDFDVIGEDGDEISQDYAVREAIHPNRADALECYEFWLSDWTDEMIAAAN